MKKAKKRKKNNIRYSKIVIFASLFLFACMIGRVIQLGLSSEIDGVDLKELASRRTTATETLSAQRGSIYTEDGEVLGTRASLDQYELVKKDIPNVQYDSISRILKIEKSKEKIGNIAICTGGTADVPVAEEAAQTAEFFGNYVERIYDVGVAGIHRILAQREKLEKANCIIVIAGMEGALASVVAGLSKVPVIAVPTSIGYGANFGGLAALLSMVNSCANGIATVNIDNGYGAGYIANQINKLAVKNN